jgi:hemoglobin-like flavoprotein
MNTQQIKLVQDTFDQVEPIAADAAALFYSRLFELDPSLRPLFKTELKAQGAKLMASLKLVVRGLDRPETILPAARMLGQRHVSYGVTNEHYATVGAALLWTLEQGLGEAFTAEVNEAWTAAYTLLASIMQEAAAEVSNPAGAD